MPAGWGPFDFEATVVHLNGDVVVAVKGEVDVATADSLWDKVEEAITLSPRVVLDLAETTFMASAGLSVLIRAYKQLQGMGGSLILRSPQASTRKTLRLTALDTIIAIEE